jgi:hypothetical protein
MQFSPPSCHFIPLWSKYTSQHPILKQSKFFPWCQRPNFAPIQSHKQNYTDILHFNIIIAYVWGSPTWFLPFRPSGQNVIHISYSRACRMCTPSNLFDLMVLILIGHVRKSWTPSSCSSLYRLFSPQSVIQTTSSGLCSVLSSVCKFI